MYYAEEIINEILCYKLSPTDAWKEVSKETLSQRVVDAEYKVRRLNEIVKELNEIVD